MNNVAVMGGAGFIGSHFIAALLKENKSVTAVDNFCSGTYEHLAPFLDDKNFLLVTMDIEDTEKLIEVTKSIDTVIHLASNPDIARAAIEPRIDFLQGTVLTESVIEACRINRIQKVLYASGSGVYGDVGSEVLTENSPLNPISTYGASKLAGEALLASYSYMFGLNCIAFRFANVVGPMQTHGVGHDFMKKLKKNPTTLQILGDGLQSKSYVYVTDVIKAVLLASENAINGFHTFNISTDDKITVNQIANEALKTLGLDRSFVKFEYTGGRKGWKADVPVVCLSSQKIMKLGWKPEFTSIEAISKSLNSMLNEQISYL